MTSGEQYEVLRLNGRPHKALDDPDGGREAAEAIRSLIGGIVINPGDKRGEVHISLRGELMGILDLAHANETKRETRFMTAAVAGPRNQRRLRCQVTGRSGPP
ncbi:hypothetical protein LDL36_13475 [Komagataeibacter sp. FNDCR1]|nr:hypothetical protein [Komagataeibacter sp. FNDCR1]